MNPHGIRAFAPGRANLIGEHTDYNEGLCLPFAVELGVTVTARLRDGDEVVSADLDEEDPYLRGAVAELRRAGLDVPGCAVEVSSDLPLEAGLSSSAALCVALVLALAKAGGREPDPVEVARMCSRIERDWTGADTGLLDQLASLLGEAGHALRLDMRTLEATPVPLELGEHLLAVVDSGATRSLAESGYNERREECRRAAEALGVESLRDAGGGEGLPAPLDRRVRHVIGENERVDSAVAALAAGDMARLGELLDASHASLRDDYEVSVPEVEETVIACREAGAIGARIMGGGFGGSVIALFPPAAEPPRGALRLSAGRGARVAVC
ncbi:MAG TPA: galactokinase family protein [Thermoleophilaceae bacterium]|nr:galactokinase family protein [Thermoleophilaceae bacterium]